MGAPEADDGGDGDGGFEGEFEAVGAAGAVLADAGGHDLSAVERKDGDEIEQVNGEAAKHEYCEDVLQLRVISDGVPEDGSAGDIDDGGGGKPGERASD
ncbi:MAG: hypothetical protein RL215_2660 [Planctomycetota bacterium]